MRESLYQPQDKEDDHREVTVTSFLSVQQALGEGGLEKANWLPGTGNPDGGLARVRSDMVPLLRLLESGGCRLGQLGVWKESRLSPPEGCRLSGSLVSGAAWMSPVAP